MSKEGYFRISRCLFQCIAERICLHFAYRLMPLKVKGAQLNNAPPVNDITSNQTPATLILIGMAGAPSEDNVSNDNATGLLISRTAFYVIMK